MKLLAKVSAEAATGIAARDHVWKMVQEGYDTVGEIHRRLFVEHGIDVPLDDVISFVQDIQLNMLETDQQQPPESTPIHSNLAVPASSVDSKNCDMAEQTTVDFNKLPHVVECSRSSTEGSTSSFLEIKVEVESMMADQSISVDDIRRRMEGRTPSPVVVEAILMGEFQTYTKTISLMTDGVSTLEEIYEYMTVVEGGNPQLVKSVLLQDSNELDDTPSKPMPETPRRSSLAFRAVNELVLIDKAQKMKKVGVPEGGIFQKLVGSGLMNEDAEDILDELHEAELAEAAAAVAREAEGCGPDFPLRTSSVHIYDETEDVYDDDDDDYLTSEEDSESKLRTAVYRKVKEMIEEGKSDTEIRVELVAMKCVDQELVDCFLDDVSGGNSSSEEEDSTVAEAVCDHNEFAFSYEILQSPIIEPLRTPRQERERARCIQKIIMMQRAGVPEEAVRQRLCHPNKYSIEFVDAVLSQGLEIDPLVRMYGEEYYLKVDKTAKMMPQPTTIDDNQQAFQILSTTGNLAVVASEPNVILATNAVPPSA